MNPAELRSFAHRDWQSVAEAKIAYWLEQKSRWPIVDVIALADDLRRHALSLRPDWPGADERAADLAVHVRVSEALGAVDARSR